MKVIILGQMYEVVRKNPALENMKKRGIAFELYLAKPKGKVIYHTVQYDNGYVRQNVQSLGGMGITR